MGRNGSAREMCRHRARRALKWIGTAACIVLAAVFVASGWSSKEFRFNLGTQRISCGVERGYLDVIDVYPPSSANSSEMVWMAVTPRDRRRTFDFWPPPAVTFARPDEGWCVVLPLWIPFILIAVPTALLWRLDRRRTFPGHCRKCNYNLAGNTSGVCPECGSPIGAPRGDERQAKVV